MLEVALPRVPVAGRESAGAVADLDEVTELVAGLIAMRLVPMITFQGGDRVEAHGEASTAGQDECPGAVAV